MRVAVGFFTLFCLGLLCTGCPTPGDFRFTNADTSTGGLLGGILAYATGATEDTQGAATNETSREVVEPDVIRRDGSMLYILNQYRGLTLVDLDTGKVAAQVPTYGYPRDLYIAGNHAYVLVGYASSYRAEGNLIVSDVASRLYAVDLSDLTHPAVHQFDLNGDLVDSRLVGDVLYAVCAEYQYYTTGVAVAKEQTSSSWVTSVNIANETDIHKVDEVSLDGFGSVIQATNSAIFVAAPDWSRNKTAITYVDISDPNGAIAVAGSIEVDGYVPDQYKMDAYQGVLRVVSNDWNWNWNRGRKNIVTTISLADPMHLEKLGEVELVDAAGESLFATRFDGPRAYVVTFLVKDPLFVIDLSDPVHPTVAGKLEVPGWSTHIEPQGNRLIALGVDDTAGRRVCVTMFDVTDPAHPTQVGDRVTFGDDWSWSSAYYDVKAFTVLDDVLIVPFSGWTSNGGYERLQFIGYGNDGLTAGGYVDVTGSVLRSFEYEPKYYGVTSEQLVTIDGSDLAHPVVEKTLTLAEYVNDYFKLSETADAAVIANTSSGKTLVRTLDAVNDSPMGEAAVDIGSLAKAYAYGQSVVLVGTYWDSSTYAASYRVAKVDCSNPETPVASAVLPVDVTPFWSYWYGYYDSYGAMPMVAEASDAGNTSPDSAGSSGTKMAYAYWWPWWTPQNTTFLVGDVLALRCSSESFDTVFGGGVPYQGLALVNLPDLEWTSTAGLGFSEIVSMDAAGNKLYIGTQEYAGMDLLRPVCANYLRGFNPAALTMGPAVNVPGTFVQYDPAKGLLVVRDNQWDGLWNYSSSLRSLRWNGGAQIDPLDKVALPDNVGVILGRGSRIYCDAHTGGYVIPMAEAASAGSTSGGTVSSAKADNSGYRIYAITLDDDGGLQAGDGVLVTKDWGNLLDASGATALVTVGNVIATYDFSGEGALEGFYETMGYPLSVHFTDSAAYVPLGYTGFAKLVR